MQLSERDISILIDEVPSDLTLPRSGTDPPPRGRVREEIQHARDRGLDDDAPPTAGETILIVDDDEDIARFLEVNLRLAGYEVAVAANGEQALLQAEELRPDLVILDVLMPYGIDGFEVARRLRGSRITDDTSIIMLTCPSAPNFWTPCIMGICPTGVPFQSSFTAPGMSRVKERSHGSLAIL